MADHPGGGGAGRTGSRVANPHRTDSPTGRTVRYAAAEVGEGSGCTRGTGGGTPQEDGGNMELKPGYKLTEVGMIPADWDVSCLALISKLSSGTTPSRSQHDHYYRNGKYHWVKTTDLNNSRITTTEEKVTQAALDETCLQVYPPGTVFVAMYGGFNQIGRTGILEIPAAVNQALIAIQTKTNKLDPAYLLANLNYRVEYWKSVASSSRKDPNITSQDVKNFAVPIPNVNEQRSIATALSDMDALLAALDRLIAKKRDLKQAAMQQLLTGKTRLPGFGGEWEVKRIGDIATSVSDKNITGEALPVLTCSKHLGFMEIGRAHV